MTKCGAWVDDLSDSWARGGCTPGARWALSVHRLDQPSLYTHSDGALGHASLQPRSDNRPATTSPPTVLCLEAPDKRPPEGTCQPLGRREDLATRVIQAYYWRNIYNCRFVTSRQKSLYWKWSASDHLNQSHKKHVRHTFSFWLFHLGNRFNLS